MKNKLIILFIFSALILANIIIYKITAINQEQRINAILNSISDQLQTHYELQIHHQTLVADSAYQSTIRNKKAMNILKQAVTASSEEKVHLRKELYELLIGEYHILQMQGVLQYQFNFKDNRTFLRLHKPSKFGDDLTKVRYSYTYVNKEHKIIRGLEQGKTTHGFRNVYPIFDEKNNYLCAMEISYSSDLLQKMLNDISKIHTHFIVNKKVIDVKVWKRDDFISTYQQSDENKDYMVTQIKDHNNYEHFTYHANILDKFRELISQELAKNEKFNFYNIYKNKTYIVSFYPIKNIKEQKAIAWLVAYETNDSINSIINYTIYIRVLSFIIFCIIAYFIYWNILQKQILKVKVKKKTKELEEINQNLEEKISLEVEKNKQTQQQLFKSEKMASMGEMIGNIAHQWRQPLSIISTGATGLILQKEYDSLTDGKLINTCKIIDENAQYLSKTIDDFRDFIKGDKKAVLFNLEDTIHSFIHLIDTSIRNHNINIILNIDKNIQLENHPNELIQCLINIYNNARDILKNEDMKRYIFINTVNLDDTIVIKIKDNAGGIKEEIFSKIFEPYFTTKHKSQGTGLGLHMTYNLIVHGMKGTIEVKNVDYRYKRNKYHGAEFIITLPKKLK